MSGEIPGNGAPEGWFGEAGGQAGAAPEGQGWQASSVDDVTTQMPKIGGSAPGPALGNGYAPANAPNPAPGNGYTPANGYAPGNGYGYGAAPGPDPTVAMPAQPQPQPPAPTPPFASRPQPQPAPAPIPAPADMWGGIDDRTRQAASPFGAPPPPPFQPRYQPDQRDPDPFAPAPRRRRTKLWIGTGIGTAAVLSLAAVLVFNEGGSPGSGSGAHAAAPKPTPLGFQPTATSPAGDAAQTAEAFLSAWQSGNDSKAASLTDDPTDAAAVLAAYRSGLNLHGLTLTEKNATAAGLVDFSVSAQVSSVASVSAGATAAPSPSAGGGSASPAATPGGGAASSVSGTWTYSSQLTAYQKNGGWCIKWDPALTAPSATNAVHPVALAIEPGAKSVTDARGGSLSASSQSALVNIAALVKKNAKTNQGTVGLEVVFEDAKGKIVSGSTRQLLAPVATAVVKTTIDPHLESLAVTAIGKFPRSSLVVIRPSTGAILAVANSSGAGDNAFTGTLAPGSSMKVVTTASLMLHGLLPQGINTQVGCPLVVTVQGVKIHNSTSSPNSLSGTEDYEPPNTPFSTDFSMSCNNAFTQWWQQMAGGKLADTALNYFGLNQPWDLGLGTPGVYFKMPTDQSGSELAEELYGQGVIEANPLSMASVAATVDTGSFHQPYLVAGLTDLKTATPLPSSVKSALYTVMREVVTSGTAAGVGFGAGVYGKTGTAEADANKDHNPNGWMIVFDPSKDLAVAAVVIDSNFGAATAGPEVNYVLQHY